MSASSIVATLNAVTGERCGASVGVEASQPKVLSLRIYSKRAWLAEALQKGAECRFGRAIVWQLEFGSFDDAAQTTVLYKRSHAASGWLRQLAARLRNDADATSKLMQRGFAQ